MSLHEWWGCRRGRCTVCGGKAVREQRFEGEDAREVYLRSREWSNQPVTHAKCEQPPVGDDA